MNKEKELKAVRRGDEAKALLDNPVQEEAWQAIRERLLFLMESARTDEAALKAKLALNLLTDVRQYWQRIVNDGVVAAQTIKLEEEKRKWYQRRVA